VVISDVIYVPVQSRRIKYSFALHPIAIATAIAIAAAATLPPLGA